MLSKQHNLLILIKKDMALDAQTEKDLLEKIGKEATEATKKAMKDAEKNISDKQEDLIKGLMSEKDFEAFKQEQIAPINETLKRIEDASKEQGNKVASLLEKAAPNSVSFEQFLEGKAEEIKSMREQANGKAFMEFSAAELKAAGVYSIAGTIPTPSPYAPGLGGAELEIFDIVRNPNFITSRVNLGRTNQSRLAWANEIDYQGAPAIVAEGATKPQTQHTFEIETSNAKKIAGWIELTDEFDQDLPAFATTVRRMLNNDVIRAWDDAVQTDVITAARPYEITGLDGKIQDANYLDALLAMLAQVGSYNFVPNTLAYNWITNAIVKTLKNTNGTYLTPMFAQQLDLLTVYANKMADYYALAGDLKQYNVDIYKDFVIKVGWINDEFVKNKFAIVGEIRYHSYISSARKKALVYDSLDDVSAQILKP